MHPAIQDVAQQIETRDGVYGPREDSYLLASATADRTGHRLLEVGTGTGFVAAVASRNFDETVAVDIDPNAVELARRNLSGATVLRSDLFENVEGTFDLVLFNPPYLPTDEGTEGDAALDGGPTGREVLRRFVHDLPDHLAPGGAALILVSTLTGLDEVQALLRDQGLTATRVDAERLFFEELVVLEARRG